MEDIPEDEDKCSAWLHKLYQEKVGAMRWRWMKLGLRVEDTILMGGHREPVTVCPERPTCQAAKEPSRCPHRQ